MRFARLTHWLPRYVESFLTDWLCFNSKTKRVGTSGLPSNRRDTGHVNLFMDVVGLYRHNYKSHDRKAYSYRGRVVRSRIAKQDIKR